MQSLVEKYWRHRFAVLFVTLVSTVVAKPLFEPISTPRIIDILLMINLFSLVIGLGGRRLLWAAMFAACFVVLHELRAVVSDRTIVSLATLIWLLGCLAGLVATVGQVLRPGIVDAERIFAALDAYVLAGLIFGVSYYALNRVFPGSFDSTEAAPFNEFRAIYFSFVTLATLGYGDYTPNGNLGHTLAVLEALLGQLYLVTVVSVVVARLGLQRRRRGEFE
jgi:ion channel